MPPPSSIAVHNFRLYLLVGEKEPKVSFASLANELKRLGTVLLQVSVKRRDIEHKALRKILKRGRYAFIEYLGGGSFGRVSKYLDMKMCKVVAGKEFELSKVGNELVLLRVRKDELDVLLRASEKLGPDCNLARLHDVFYDGRRPVLMMECMDFCLEDHLRNEDLHRKRENEVEREKKHEFPANLKQFLDMAMQLLNGLNSLHGSDRNARDIPHFVHRDVKPSNIGIVIGPGNRVDWKLIDFGFAKKMVEFEGQLAAVDTLVKGSWPFVSPQALTKTFKASDDLFALGVVLFMVLCHWRHPSSHELVPREVKPYKKELEVAKEVVDKYRESYLVVNFDRARFRENFDTAFLLGKFALDPDQIRQRLEEIIFKMIDLDDRPGHRYNSAGDVKKDFRSLQAELFRDSVETEDAE